MSISIKKFKFIFKTILINIGQVFVSLAILNSSTVYEIGQFSLFGIILFHQQLLAIEEHLGE